MAVIGITTGMMAGVIGAGGGFLTVVLLLASGMNPHIAVGSSLVFALVVAGWGSILHLRQGTGDALLALALGIPAAVTSILGAKIVDGLSDRVITVGFAALIIVVIVAFLRTPKDRPIPDPEIPGTGGPWRLIRKASTPSGVVHYSFGVPGAIAGGGFVGILKGMFGVGGGFILVPFMVSVMRIPDNVAVGASLMAILIGSVTGAVTHAFLGNVDWYSLAALIPGGLLGSFIGTGLSGRLKPATLRMIFILAMTGSAIYLVASELL